MSDALKEIAERKANGADVDPMNQPFTEQPDAPQVERSAAPSAAEAIIDAQVRNVIGTVIRGLMVSAPGIPVHVLMNSICRQTGNLCAGAISGDVEAVARVRTGFRLAFVDGVQKVPIVKPQGPTPRPAG